MSIATSLTALQIAKTNIANAITDKGGTVASGDGFLDFASDIATIPTSSSYFDYTNILKAQGIIASPAGSVDLTDADFQGLTSITTGIFAASSSAGTNHP